MAKSPIKFGLGEYSDKPFELKSGNTPLFKHVGSSPYKQGTRFSPNTNTDKDKLKNLVEKENKDIIVKGGGKRNIGQILAEGITGGLDAVYGTGKVKYDNTVQVAKNKEEVDKKSKTISENIIDEGTGGEDLNALIAKRETLTEGSAEWKENQNKINEALGNKKRH